ncbi:hypothetical protein MY3296_007848 [Beauveria thailandica]
MLDNTKVTDVGTAVRSTEVPTVGAILMEWNVAAKSQGAAAMWDSHFRVGGALATHLDLATCPRFSNNAACITASLLFRVMPQSKATLRTCGPGSATTIMIRPLSTSLVRVLRKSPSLPRVACSLPFVVLRWRLGALCPPSGARGVFMGHTQTESPYYQPNPRPPDTVRAGARFPNDPDFSGCDLAAAVEEDRCNYVWILLVIDSTDVMVHSAGLYSFFNEYYQDCIASHNCQTRILEVKRSTCVIIFTLFSIAMVNITGGMNGTKVLQRITSVASPPRSAFGCRSLVTYSAPSCMFIILITRLGSTTTIHPSNYATSFEYGGFGPTTIGGSTTTVFITLTTTVDGIRIG